MSNYFNFKVPDCLEPIISPQGETGIRAGVHKDAGFGAANI